jgi:hypothetical protein
VGKKLGDTCKNKGKNARVGGLVLINNEIQMGWSWKNPKTIIYFLVVWS